MKTRKSKRAMARNFGRTMKTNAVKKDIDARWTEKNGEKHFGYKDHVKVDSDSKMIVDFSVTDAAVHDSQAIVDLIDDKDNVLNADSAYTGKELHDKIREKSRYNFKYPRKGIPQQTVKRGTKKASNKEKSKVRARVEHVFWTYDKFDGWHDH